LSQAPPWDAPAQVVAAEAKPSAGQVPDEPVQLSATSHCPAEPRHVKVFGWKTSTHVFAAPLQWSVPSHAPPWEAPAHVVAADAKPSAGQVPDDPVQLSATSHCPAEPRHVNAADWNTSTHELLLPAQWSAASLSQAPPWEAPAQVVAADAKPSAGHVPDVPVQLSATSHCPAESRQVKVFGWKTSTHVFAVPLQWSVPSHAPPFDVPLQVVAAVANPSAGQTPDDPVQLSATSHCPVEPRHVKVFGWKTSTQVFAVPLQWSVPSHAPPWEAPAQVVAADAKPSAGQVPDDPVQLSATSHCPADPRHVNAADWNASTHELLLPAQ
jgi:hypothetical protein